MQLAFGNGESLPMVNQEDNRRNSMNIAANSQVANDEEVENLKTAWARKLQGLIRRHVKGPVFE